MDNTANERTRDKHNYAANSAKAFVAMDTTAIKSANSKISYILNLSLTKST